MGLKLYNTLTRKKEDFVPLDDKDIRMYVCGPTVYDNAHIGNARPIIVFDVLFRLLRHIYGEAHVTYVRNITDVDDKINARAATENVLINEITARTIKQFHADIEQLGVLPPNVEPRATEHIAGMIAMIKTLIKNGHAYIADGHVLFDVSSDAGYGCLSNRSTDEMLAGARVDVASYKKNPMDFVLWKPSTSNLPGWDSPWGRGRPGWHIECSVMSEKYLGKTFDIHGGGADLIFPHHENEIAQSTCAHGNKLMAKYWVHNGYLQVEGTKMSKSLGNFITIHDLLKDWPGEILRFNMLKTHYRQPIDWTLDGLKESEHILKKLRLQRDNPRIGDGEGIGDGYGYGYGSGSGRGAGDGSGYGGGSPQYDFLEALYDDLNTPLAISILHELDGQELANCMALMGLTGKLIDPRASKVDATNVESLIAARNTARAEKNWAEADRIRDELAAQGIILKDGPEGTTWEIKR